MHHNLITEEILRDCLCLCVVFPDNGTIVPPPQPSVAFEIEL